MRQDVIPAEVAAVVNSIAERFAPEKIYLFSDKRTSTGDVTGFKLCIVLECESRTQSERDIYLSVDSSVPFDVLVYSPEQFAHLCEEKGSFARTIMEKGVLLHE